MRYPISLSLLPGVWLASACAGGGAVDIGEGREIPPGLLGASLTDYAGTWEGYAEAFTWNDGHDRVRITLDAAGVGTLRVGEAPDLAPPDPAHDYPPNSANPNGMALNAPPLVAGYSYAVHAAKVESQRIRFTAASSELYGAWCAMQQPYQLAGVAPTYSCIPGVLTWGKPDLNAPPVCTTNPSFDPPDRSADKPVDCGQALTCTSHCVCDATNCIAFGGDDMLMDAALRDNGETLEGTLVVVDSRITVRMTRM